LAHFLLFEQDRIPLYENVDSLLEHDGDTPDCSEQQLAHNQKARRLACQPGSRSQQRRVLGLLCMAKD
jgi:hypothetical protein